MRGSIMKRSVAAAGFAALILAAGGLSIVFVHHSRRMQSPSRLAILESDLAADIAVKSGSLESRSSHGASKSTIAFYNGEGADLESTYRASGSSVRSASMMHGELDAAMLRAGWHEVHSVAGASRSITGFWKRMPGGWCAQGEVAAARVGGSGIRATVTLTAPADGDSPRQWCNS